MMAAGPDFYLAGSCNGWTPNSPDYKFTQDNGVYTLNLPVLTDDFKITTSDWGIQYGCASRISYGKEFPVVQSDNAYNITLPDNPAKGVVITFDYNKKTIRFDIANPLFLVGDFNDWLILPDYEFRFTDGLYVLSVPAFSGKFKIASPNSGKYYGTGATLQLDSEMNLSENGGHMEIADNPVKTKMIRIIVNPDAEPLPDPDPEETLDPDENNEPEEDNTPDTPDVDEPTTDNPSEPDKPLDPPSMEEPPSSGEPSDVVTPEPPKDEEPGEVETPQEPTEPDNGTVEEENPSTPQQPSEGEETPDNPTPEEPSNPMPAPDDTDNDPEPGVDADDNDPNPDDEEQGYVSSIIDDSETKAEYYDLTGRKVEHPSGGIFIYHSAEGVKKVYIP